MNLLKEAASKVNLLLSTLTDWFLIIVGLLLVFKALVAVDVPVARYTIMVFGVLLSGFGLWYRHRRKKRYR